MSQVEVKGLFPVPFMRIKGLAPETLVAACASRIDDSEAQRNFKSDRLQHSAIAHDLADPDYRALADLVLPHVVEFGALLFGETLPWRLKEIWTNRLEHGGHQAPHVHANSFVSGILYLTASHPSARTVFHRGLGGRDFVFSNDHPGARTGPFNGSKWVGPPCEPGDLVLYPSYLLHEVPRNEGGVRKTLAFNAIPERLDNFGYTVRFASEPSGEAR